MVEFHVRDLNRSIAFYERLGFTLGRREEGFAQLSWEGHHFLLDERRDLPAPIHLQQVNVRVLVSDVAYYWNMAKEMGAQIIDPIADRYYGLRDFTISDQDGFGVRFAMPPPILKSIENSANSP